MQRTRVGNRVKVLSELKRFCCRFYYYYYKITCEQAIVKTVSILLQNTIIL